MKTKTYIWKYAHLCYVCNSESIDLARNTFNETILKNTQGKEGIEGSEMNTMNRIVNNDLPIVLDNTQCALLTRTKE